MQNVLKGWLVDNTVTTDDLNDKILQLESAGSADFDDIISEMLKEDTVSKRSGIPFRSTIGSLPALS
jgi:hypothetical protein